MPTRQPQSFDSINEQNVYMELQALKVDFEYQVPIDGGRQVRGGQVIDFVVYLPPQKTAVRVQGAYWHNRAKAVNDQLLEARLYQLGFRVVELLELETETREEANVAIRRKVL